MLIENTYKTILYTHQMFVCVHNSLIHKHSCMHIHTMVKHIKCFLYEPDNFVNIKGFVGVKVVLCMYTKYFACI